jgi:GNAT superfamily N-acetyltransferase
MELRQAELEDLAGCAALPSAVASSHVWQLTLTRDPTATLATSEWTMVLRCLRLPRAVTVSLPGEPLDALWKRAIAVFVAAEAEQVGGFIVLTAADERPAALIARLVVAPPLRRRGTGSALLRVAAQWASGEGLTGLRGHCSARNHPAVAFYTRSGFNFCGYDEAYYPRDEVALFWQRNI